VVPLDLGKPAAPPGQRQAALPPAAAAHARGWTGQPASRAAASKPVARRPAPVGDYYQIKSTIFNALIDTIDRRNWHSSAGSARGNSRHQQVISIKAVVSIADEHLLQDICNDVLGYGPLEPLLARDDIADIMVNGANRVFIEVQGKVQLTNILFRDNAQLMNICQRIVSQVGRRVDESSPICDARLLDGSRVNVIGPPLSLTGAHHS
jgi:pilus assembly protein CpaF